MTSLIESIHAQVQEEDAPLSDVMTRAILLGSVLGQKDMTAWLKQERDGYSDDTPVPAYRRFKKGTLTAYQPGVGWVEAPITDEVNRALANIELRQGIAAIEKAWTEGRKTGGQRLDIPEDRQKVLRLQINLDAQLAMAVPAQCFGYALDAVSIAIRLWTAELIEAGVVGQGTSFREEERQAARQVGNRLDELLASAAAEAEQNGIRKMVARPSLLARLLGKQTA